MIYVKQVISVSHDEPMPEATYRAERMGNHGRNNGNYIRQTAIHKE